MRTVYTITPSWLIEERQDLADGIAALESLGFAVVNKRFVTRLPSPEAKARELHAAFADDRIDLILAQRGGYSSMKSLPYVDFEHIARHPRLFAGFSDLSTLLNTVFERTGLVTLHAPMVINFTRPTPFTVRSFLNAVDGFPERDLFRGARIAVYNSGRAQGVLKGGNLVTLSALIGTEWDISTEGAIVFLEDVDEKTHEVDRLLTQWVLAGRFRAVKGIVLGDFRGVKPREVYRVISSQMRVNVPVVYCPNIGHVPNKITLPVGARVALDTEKRSLTVL